jgi:signal transduction histidine kinase
LQQVVVNLIVNGVEAVTAVSGGRRELVIRSRRDSDSQIAVDVLDSGAGISPGDEERIFDAFFTTKAGGMGMGLTICRSIVESHGGRLWASKNSGQGATFSFTLPLTEA